MIGSGCALVVIGDQHVDMSAGHQESGDADDFIRTQGNGAHPARDPGGEAHAGAGRGQLPIEDRLSGGQRIEHRPADHIVDPDETARQRMRLRPFDQAEIFLADGLAGIERTRGGYVLLILWRGDLRGCGPLCG